MYGLESFSSFTRECFEGHELVVGFRGPGVYLDRLPNK